MDRSNLDVIVQKLKVLETIIQKLIILNNPTEILKSKLDQMESLVCSISSRYSEVSKEWANKLALHYSVYVSSTLLPPLRKGRRSSGCQTESDEDNGASSSRCLKTFSDLYQRRATSSASASNGGPSPSTSRIINHEQNQSKQTNKHVIRPSSTSNLNQADNNTSAAGKRSLKRVSFHLDGSEPSIRPEASMSHPRKRVRISRDQLRPKLVRILSEPRTVTDANDIEGLKWLLRLVHYVFRRLYEDYMYFDEELSPELYQLAFNKLSHNLKDRFRNERTADEIASNDLEHIKRFVKELIVAYLAKTRNENMARFSNGHLNANSVSANLPNPVSKYCCYCKKLTNHTVADCPVCLFMQRYVLCFYCLKDGHTIRNCPNNAK